jgi:hypothetical protein
MPTEAMMKRLHKMIASEAENGDDYELPHRFAPPLMDLGYVEFREWGLNCALGEVDCSGYFVTEKGREAYFKWIGERTEEEG